MIFEILFRRRNILSMRLKIIALTFMICLLPVVPFAADSYTYSNDNTVIGSLKTYKTKKGDSLIELARKFHLGYNEITAANPKLDPFVPGEGVTLNIPTAWVLPELSSYEGIVINLSEMRIYYFPATKSAVVTFPIGVGDEGKETPVGTFQIIEKTVHPSWHVPESIRKEKPELPKIVPPGPDNPLGSHAMRLSERTILIHGTNRPYAVGRKASHGCIRMYPEDIPKFFAMVPNKSKVHIIRQPIKVGTANNRVYMEIHKDSELDINYFNEAVRLLVKKGLFQSVDKEKMLAAVRENKGLPIDISN
jgi:L,D-transpeptidase ErfK/SrfK